jgi:iron uptake system EfeUOB component EfeO/EfeM
MYSEEEVEPLLNALKYFTDRVESGSIKSKTTYKMYKEVLEQFKKK